MKAIAEHKMKLFNIEELDLSRNQIKDPGLIALAENA